jgi:hypothetical protein
MWCLLNFKEAPHVFKASIKSVQIQGTGLSQYQDILLTECGISQI